MIFARWRNVARIPRSPRFTASLLELSWIAQPAELNKEAKDREAKRMDESPLACTNSKLFCGSYGGSPCPGVFVEKEGGGAINREVGFSSRG